ncbi:carbohydrate binding family 9 domain-containing protein [bacterium]|nr:carbohydrate binding family 9 domain-containing protein [bacterium]
MKKGLFIAMCMAGSLFARESQTCLNLMKMTQSPIIDGIIDPVWSQVDSVSDFIQQYPYYGAEPSCKTVARVLTTDDALYSLIVCYDDRDHIQTINGKLDNISGDVVGLMLDTFGNQSTAYQFAVSASGVRSDCRLLDDARNSDYTWDGIWFADARVYSWGYVVEMEIPYKSIQYDDQLLYWGLDFNRWIAGNREDLYWCSYEESEGQRISKFGQLVFNGFRPTVRGMQLEIYPVGITKAEYQDDRTYQVSPNIGLDILYNPSPKLAFQFTANPEFAQIEADPFAFNISRYETYFSERRPFFTEGNEIFMAAGRQQNMGFYRPVEFFYSRRIGKKLPDGSEVPIWAGAKTFGRIREWEYGGFLAVTGEKEYTMDGSTHREEKALFSSVRLKRQIMGNSSVGILYVGKHTAIGDNGLIDIDGAFRGSNWQLAYQLARSYRGNRGDFAGSAGFTMISESAIVGIRGNFFGDQFDVDDVGFVPRKGTACFSGLAGPRWYFNDGYISAILFYAGPYFNYEKVDAFTDYGGFVGFNMQFRNNWGYEVNCELVRSKDQDIVFDYYSANLSSWFNVNPRWHANLYGGYCKTYNFARDYLAFYSWWNGYIGWQIASALQVGSSISTFVEGNPEGEIEEVTYNTRPFISATPVNNLNVRVYVDNVFMHFTGKLEQIVGGILFSYNFSPKSWIYFAINEVKDRVADRLQVQNRAAVFKLKYLYYM